jgi:hypothetical protein
MAVLQTGQSFSSGDQVTATKLEDIANLATFRTGTNQTADDSTIQVDGSGGYLKVKSAGISSNELATDSVITAKIQDDAVTSAKLAHISNLNVLGNVSGSTAAPVGVEIKDEDDMVSDSATALATQQSIKAYVDTEVATVASPVTKYSSGFVSTDGSTSVANGATLSFTHNLGTDDLIVQVYMAQNATGSNSVSVGYINRVLAYDQQFGGIVKDLTNTTIDVFLSPEGWFSPRSGIGPNTGSWGTTYTHIKVVAIG